jgi:hypothetical protein
MMLRTWANKIEVQANGDRLVIEGTNPGDGKPRDLLSLFHNYLYASGQELEAKGPHLEFASSTSDAELIKFIERWGPITAHSVGEDSWSKQNETPLWAQKSVMRNTPIKRQPSQVKHSKSAVESLRRVRLVQKVIGAAVNLLKVSRNKILTLKTTLSAIEELIAALESVGENAREAAEPHDAWALSPIVSAGLRVDCEVIYDEVRQRGRNTNASERAGLCQDVLCALVNRYPENLVVTVKGVLSVPTSGHGVLPLLIFMLRQDLMRQRTIIVCENCGNYLLQRRHAEAACPSCKEKLRSKKHYARNREKILRERKLKRLARRRAQLAA